MWFVTPPIDACALHCAKTVDYLLRAARGQHMNVGMTTDNGASYFNVLSPGETEVAFFNGSVSGNQYEGALPATATTGSGST